MSLISRLFAAGLIFCAMMLAAGAEAGGITNYDKLVTPLYWTAKNTDGDKLVLDEKGVRNFNSLVCEASPTVPDLKKYPAAVSGDELKALVMNYQVLEDDLYRLGNKVSENYKNILRKQTNVGAIPDTVNVRYAVTVRRTPVRNLPTGEGLFYFAADKDFDALQETMLDPAEPVAVLHQSENKFFYYVQSVNYSGWVSTYNLAFTDRKTWLDYVSPGKFLVVTGANLVVKTGSEQVVYQQGARLALAGMNRGSYTVTAPVRLKDGRLMEMNVNVPKSADVHEGYLPYTMNNVLRSAFKFHNMPYGWGGLKDSVDCSSLVFNAFRTVGLVLPRNTDEQEESAGSKVALDELSGDELLGAVRGLRPGTVLYLDGHAMIYLGNIEGAPYVIHSLGSYFAGGARRQVMKVVVSDLTLVRSDGASLGDSLTSAVGFY